MSDVRIVATVEHGAVTVDGVQVLIDETIWSDGGRSFEVHRFDDGTDLTASGCFDEWPTNAEIAALLRVRSSDQRK